MYYTIEDDGIHFYTEPDASAPAPEPAEPPAMTLREALQTIARISQQIEQIGVKPTMMLYIPSEQGQGIVEYALILVLVAVVVIAILALLGPAIGNVFSTIYAAI
jgi:pilus assembly protein Flp/PilA